MSMGKSVGNWLAGRFAATFMCCVRLVSRPVALAMGSALGQLAYAIHRRSSRFSATLQNIARPFPQTNEAEQRLIASASLRHFGRFLAESGRTPLLTKDNLADLMTLHGTERLDAALAQGKGVILAWAHFGHFELGAYALALRGYPINTVIRTVDNASIDQLFDQLRERSGQRVIKKENASREILARLRHGEVVGIAYDLNAAFNNMFLPLFGELAATFTNIDDKGG